MLSEQLVNSSPIYQLKELYLEPKPSQKNHSLSEAET